MKKILMYFVIALSIILGSVIDLILLPIGSIIFGIKWRINPIKILKKSIINEIEKIKFYSEIILG